MTFTPKMEFLIDGTWVDATSVNNNEVRSAPSVQISRGLQDRQSTLVAQSMAWTQNNRDGYWSNRNPLSPYYGKLGRNTRVRYSVPPYDTYALHLENTNTISVCSTGDKAAIQLAGDIDVRVELTGSYGWRPPYDQAIAGKYRAVDGQRSWVFRLTNTGKLSLQWSTDGTSATIRGIATTALVPNMPARQAVRVTLDVDNGAAGCTANFYTAPSLAGPWTLLESITSAGTTSLWTTSPSLEFGSAAGGGSPISGGTKFYGKVHGGELRSSIGGATVADFDPTTQTASSWSDGLGNTWSVTARMTNDQTRFCGELGSTSPTWDVTGRDISLPMIAYGALKRLQGAAQPLRSSVFRQWIQEPDLIGYWPMEDVSGTLKPSSVAGTTKSGVVDGTFSGSTPAGLAGSGGALTLGSAGKVQLYAAGRASTGTASFTFYFTVSALPITDVVFLDITGNGTIREFKITIGPGGFTFTLLDSGGATLDSATVGFGDSPVGQWLGFEIILTQEGTDVRWEVIWHAVGKNVFWTPVAGGRLVTVATCGRLGTVTVSAQGDAALAGMQIAHVKLTKTNLRINTAAFRDASKGYDGETAGNRLLRLATEENVLLDVYGDPDDTGQMGPQTISSVFDLISEAVTLDGGQLYEARDVFSLIYKARTFLQNRHLHGDFAISYPDSILSAVPQPIEDSSATLNDITLTATRGGTARAVAADTTYGPLNVLDPPDGISRVQGSLPAVGAYDPTDQLNDLVNYQLYIRTRDELRIPQIAFGLHRPEITTTLRKQIQALDVGDHITVSNWPTGMPVGSTGLSVYGYTESIDQLLWSMAANTVNDAGYRSSQLTGPDEIKRLDTFNSILTSAASSSATVLDVTTGNGLLWSTTRANSGEFPLVLMVEGEEITVTGISNPGSVANDPGDFENGVSNWTATGGTLSQSSVQKHSVGFSALITVSGSPVSAGLRTASGVWASVVAGRQYLLTFWIFSSIASVNVNGVVNWKTSGGAAISSSGLPTFSVPANTWTLVSGLVTAPATAALAEYGPTLGGTPPNGTLFYADEVDLIDMTDLRRQRFRVTRSTNGIIKAQTANVPVYVRDYADTGM